MAAMTLGQLAEQVRGRIVAQGIDDCLDLCLTDALPLQDATDKCITLADHPKHVQRVNQSAAAVVMVKSEIEGCCKPQLVVDDLHASFQQAIICLRPPVTIPERSGAHASAVIDPSASVGAGTWFGAGVTVDAGVKIGERCQLHAGVHIMADCTLGDDCEIYPSTVLYPGTRLGHRVLIHAGAVLGAFGFGYRSSAGSHIRTAQLGWVEVGDDVEIGANATIDRGTYGPTRISDGTKLDNQVQIGHNVQLGRHNLICAHVGIAGSTSTGTNVVLAGQVGLADHIHLADNVVVGAQSGVMNDIPPGEVVLGSPAIPRRKALQDWASSARLPEMRKTLTSLQRQLSELNQQVLNLSNSHSHKQSA
jgi:UDP-3-O-[3-hydroxymyristoyl] glucosamine N-acyltransferase